VDFNQDRRRGHLPSDGEGGIGSQGNKGSRRRSAPDSSTNQGESRSDGGGFLGYGISAEVFLEIS